MLKSIIFSLIFSILCFVVLDYKTLVFLNNVVILLVPIYGAPMFVGKPEKCKDPIIILFLMVFAFSFCISPIKMMSSQEKQQLPCKGYIDPELESKFNYLPEYSHKCTSVFHAGHGRIVNGVHLLSYKDVEYSTRDMIDQYKQKKQYVFSCRGKQNPILDLMKLNISFLFQDKNIEEQDDKEIIWFAKEGTLLVSLISVWVDFN